MCVASRISPAKPAVNLCTIVVSRPAVIRAALHRTTAAAAVAVEVGGRLIARYRDRARVQVATTMRGGENAGSMGSQATDHVCTRGWWVERFVLIVQELHWTGRVGLIAI